MKQMAMIRLMAIVVFRFAFIVCECVSIVITVSSVELFRKCQFVAIHGDPKSNNEDDDDRKSNGNMREQIVNFKNNVRMIAKTFKPTEVIDIIYEIISLSNLIIVTQFTELHSVAYLN